MYYYSYDQKRMHILLLYVLCICACVSFVVFLLGRGRRTDGRTDGPRSHRRAVAASKRRCERDVMTSLVSTRKRRENYGVDGREKQTIIFRCDAAEDLSLLRASPRDTTAPASRRRLFPFAPLSLLSSFLLRSSNLHWWLWRCRPSHTLLLAEQQEARQPRDGHKAERRSIPDAKRRKRI